jgi:hypothetical protein
VVLLNRRDVVNNLRHVFNPTSQYVIGIKSLWPYDDGGMGNVLSLPQYPPKQLLKLLRLSCECFPFLTSGGEAACKSSAYIHTSLLSVCPYQILCCIRGSYGGTLAAAANMLVPGKGTSGMVDIESIKINNAPELL